MSAITGIYHVNGEPVPQEHGLCMMKALQKFPADDIQTWYKGKVFLGCHSQWITPESIGEQLPYYNPEWQLAITADAIIDNRDELFERLQVNPEDRKTMTDSELILLAYLKWGDDTPKFLVGDFAFMIWDERNNKMFGARDFSGARTLYFFRDHNRFAFSTIIKPLLGLPYVEKELNEQWLAEFLAIPVNFESIDPSSTTYLKIYQIPPSHSITCIDGKTKLSRYCMLHEGDKLRLRSNQEYEEAFRDIFQTAVTSRLRTYRNIGAHLSGGLDSGSVASFAARTLQKERKKLHTFSHVPLDDFVDWTPKSRTPDERPLILSTVKHVGNINDHYLSFEGKSSLSEIDDWLETLEMPYKFFENSYWLKGIYEEASKLGINILLNGQRGNWTVSWGPAIDYQAMLFKRLKLVHFYRELQLYSKNMGVNKGRIFSIVRKRAFPRLRLNPFKGEKYSIPMLINPNFAERIQVFNKLQEYKVDITGSITPNAYEMKKVQFNQLYYWSTNGTYTTKLSLRHSIWDRDPTNDLRVVKFCLSLPEEQFVQNGQDRSLIRRSTKNYLPDNVRLNQRTRGLQGADGIQRMIPDWGLFIEELQQLSKDNRISEYLNMEVIKSATERLRVNPLPENVYEDDFRVLMRSLIVYRFLKGFT